MKYESLPPASREWVVAELASGEPERICRALVQTALNEPERGWVEDTIASNLQSEDAYVRGVSATCAGHVARIHRALDVDRLLPLIRALGSDPETLGRMQDALADIERFVRRG